MKTNKSEVLSALFGSVVCSAPFTYIWWLYGRSGNPYNTDSWLVGVPAIVVAPVAVLFGAVLGLWIRADLKKLRDILRSEPKR